MPDTKAKDGDLARLTDFLRDRDAPCPLCGYNLRDLTGDVCPECDHKLELTIGAARVRFGWFLATITPSLFSGVGGVLLLLMFLVVSISSARPINAPPMLYLLCLLGVASGLLAVALIAKRHRFILLPVRVQRNWAIAAWSIHGLPFMALVLLLIATS